VSLPRENSWRLHRYKWIYVRLATFRIRRQFQPRMSYEITSTPNQKLLLYTFILLSSKNKELSNTYLVFTPETLVKKYNSHSTHHNKRPSNTANTDRQFVFANLELDNTKSKPFQQYLVASSVAWLFKRIVKRSQPSLPFASKTRASLQGFGMELIRLASRYSHDFSFKTIGDCGITYNSACR